MLNCYRIVNEQTREISLIPYDNSPEIRAANGLEAPLPLRLSAFILSGLTIAILSALKVVTNKA